MTSWSISRGTAALLPPTGAAKEKGYRMRSGEAGRPRNLDELAARLPWLHGRTQTAPSAERNRQPILEVLARVLPPRGLVLEIGSGTGQHVAHFAKALPALAFQPSERDVERHASVAA